MVTAVALALAVSFESIVTQRFESWDANANGILSRNEVDALVGNDQVKDAEAAAIAVINQIHNRESGAIKLAKQDLIDRAPGLTKRFNYLLKVIQRASEVIFEPGDPKISQIHQGRMGNCFAVAPTGSMAFHFPESIRRSVSKLQDGSYEIKFPKRTIKLKGPTDAEIATSGLTEGGGHWVALFEKCIATALSQNKDVETDAVNDTIAKGGSSRPVLTLLTGKESTKYDLKNAEGPSTLLRIADAAGKRQILAVASTGNKDYPPGITPKHAYAVLRLDQGKVVLWNPHGDAFNPKGPEGLQFGYRKQNGIFRVLPQEATRIFGVCVTSSTELLLAGKS